ncbi:MAG: transposase [Acutalibacteraceae bacterium]
MITVDKYAVMPDHVHLILTINRDPCEQKNAEQERAMCAEKGRAMRAPTVSTVINQMKGFVTKKSGFSFWQKLFYDHIIRNETEYRAIWQYIDMNPQKWIEEHG